MTTTLSVNGEVLIPQRVRRSLKLKAGADFTVIARSNGDILLRPVQAPRRHRTLADNLLALSGLKLQIEQGAVRETPL